MPAFLRLVQGDAPSGRYEIPDDRPCVLGRAEGCDARIDHTALSRQHCRFELRNDGWHVVDLGSTNGTRVGGFRVSDTVIAYGEHLQIGRLKFEFQPGTVRDADRLAATTPPVDPLAGRHFGRFHLLRRLHVGRSGIVFRAHDTQRDRVVALKLLSAQMTKDEDSLRRFERGIHTASPVHHPAIVQLYSIGQTEEQWWLAMEWVDGPSVRDLLAEQGTLSPDQTVQIARDMAGALEAAHQEGVVHRNIKPSSMLVSAQGTAKLGDFLLARAVALDAKDQITQAGEVVGDVLYTAPECLQDASDVDCRADLYSLGVCMYHMLTGRPPHDDENVLRAMSRILNEPPQAPRQLNPAIPQALEAIVLKCLVKDRAQRYQTARELADALAAMTLPATAPASDEEPTVEYEPQARPAAAAAVDAAHDPLLETTVRDDLVRPAVPPTSPHPEPLDIQIDVKPDADRFWSGILAPASPQDAATTRRLVLKITGAVVVLLVLLGVLAHFGPRKIMQTLAAMVTFRQEAKGDKPAESKDAGDDADATSPDTKKSPAVAATTPSKPAGKTRKPAQPILQPTPAARGKTLIVEPGSPFRDLNDALSVAREEQIIEVGLDSPIKSEIKLPPKSLTLVAAKAVQPVFANTVHINGGGTVRLERFHFDLKNPEKPALQVDAMPERLELVSCTFRDAHDGVLIAINRPAEAPAKPPLLVIEQSFLAGYILIGVQDWLPDLRLSNNCLVADLAALDWQLTPEGARADAKAGILMRHNTVQARSVFSVRLADQKAAIEEWATTTVRLDDNIFAFPPQYPASLFRWESWREAAVPRDRLLWEGGRNTFFGEGKWTMAESLALSDPSARPQPLFDSPAAWKEQWAKKLADLVEEPIAFAHEGEPKKIGDVRPADFAIRADAADEKKKDAEPPPGADIAQLPTPPGG
jgi:serine/threonine-protein kinase